jgi:hypothetical protein
MKGGLEACVHGNVRRLRDRSLGRGWATGQPRAGGVPLCFELCGSAVDGLAPAIAGFIFGKLMLKPRALADTRMTATREEKPRTDEDQGARQQIARYQTLRIRHRCTNRRRS